MSRRGFGRVTTMDADDLIERSISHNEIVTAPYTPYLAHDLWSESDDNVAADDLTHEYWGTAADDSGSELPWRVHLTGRRDIVVGDVLELHTADDERPDPEALSYYVAVRVTIAGTDCRVGVCVGARESDHGSVRASGAGVRPYCTAWWVDASDWDDLPGGWRDAVEGELQAAARRLYNQAADRAACG